MLLKSEKTVNIKQQIFMWEEMLHSLETFTISVILQNFFYCLVKGEFLDSK